MPQIGDLVFRNMDFPGAETIADRLAVNNPLAQVDDKSEIPPQVQMQLKQQAAQLQQAQQTIQQMQQIIKDRTDTQEVKEQHADKRKLMEVTAKAHDIELRDAERRHDTELRTQVQAMDTVIKTETQKEIEHIKGQFALLLASISDAATREASSEATERAI
jgi:hypothetical protein